MGRIRRELQLPDCPASRTAIAAKEPVGKMRLTDFCNRLIVTRTRMVLQFSSLGSRPAPPSATHPSTARSYMLRSGGFENTGCTTGALPVSSDRTVAPCDLLCRLRRCPLGGLRPRALSALWTLAETDSLAPPVTHLAVALEESTVGHRPRPQSCGSRLRATFLTIVTPSTDGALAWLRWRKAERSAFWYLGLAASVQEPNTRSHTKSRLLDDPP